MLPSNKETHVLGTDTLLTSCINHGLPSMSVHLVSINNLGLNQVIKCITCDVAYNNSRALRIPVVRV